jgi:hypothetical protein
MNIFLSKNFVLPPPPVIFILFFAFGSQAALQTIGKRKNFFSRKKILFLFFPSAEPNPPASPPPLYCAALQIDAFKLFFKKNIFQVLVLFFALSLSCFDHAATVCFIDLGKLNLLLTV